MTNKDVLKEGKVTYVTKIGLNDEEGNIIIPMEYDYISCVTPNLYVATKGAIKGLLVGAGGESFYAEDIRTYTDKSIENNKTIDSELHFYSLSAGKLAFDKKIRACIHCKGTDTFLILDEKYRWSFAYVDFAENKIIENEKYNGFRFIVQNYNNRKFSFIIDNTFIVLSLNEENEISLITCLENQTAHLYHQGMVLENDSKQAFMNYDRELLIQYNNHRIVPFEDYIRVDKDEFEGVYSYEGKEIVPCEYLKISKEVMLGDTFFRTATANEKGEKVMNLYSMEQKLFSSTCKSIEINPKGYIIIDGEELYKYDKELNYVKTIYPNTLYNVKDMKFVYKNGNSYIRGKKHFRYALFDLYGYQLSPFRFKFFITSVERNLYS